MYKDSSHYTMTKMSNGIWYYYAYDKEGVRYKRSTGYKNKREAEDEVRRRIRQDILVEKPDVEYLQKVSFAEFAEPFWIWDTCPIIRDKLARGGHYSRDLCLSNRHSMEKHILPFFADIPVREITPKHIDQWLLNLPEIHNITASTANKMMSILRQMLDVAVFEGLIVTSPANNIKPLVEKPNRRGAFTVEEVEAILGMKWDFLPAYVACYIAAFTGMRLGEIRALQPKYIKKGYIVITHSWSDTAGLKAPKNGKARIVPLTARMNKLLFDLSDGLEEDELIFSNDGKIPYEDRRITDPLKSIMKDIGIDYENKDRKLSFHSFRHFFNTQMVASGKVSAEIIRSVIGHESEEMTEYYLHIGKDELHSIQEAQNALVKKIQVPSTKRQRTKTKGIVV